MEFYFSQKCQEIMKSREELFFPKGQRNIFAIMGMVAGHD